MGGLFFAAVLVLHGNAVEGKKGELKKYLKEVAESRGSED